MTQALDFQLPAHIWQSSGSSSHEVFAQRAAEYEDAGSRDTAKPWQGAKAAVRPLVSSDSFSFLEVAKDFVVVLGPGMVLLLDTGSADLPPWNVLRSALADSAVQVRGVLEVRNYLDKHSDMFGVTERICQAARSEFGQEAFLTLRVYRDPEIDDEYLLLRVRLRSYPPDTMPRIRSLSDPYQNELSDKSGSIIVTTDFRPIW
jgi:hypothetical protein